MAVVITEPYGHADARSPDNTITVESERYSTSVNSNILILEGDPYSGSYDIIPKMEAQVLPTKFKTMSDDVTVEGIPHTMAGNPSGGYTVVIGGD